MSSGIVASSVESSSKIDRVFLALIVAFLGSRILAYACGVAFDPIGAYQWQLVDPPLLKDRWFESLLNLHSQPPLFNALHGVVLKLTSSVQGQINAWRAIHFVLGIAMLSFMYGSLRMLSASRALSAVLTGLFVCSPAAIAYENFLSYTYVDAAFLSAAVYFLIRSVRKQSARCMWLFFTVLTAMCWTRAAYHLLWLLGVGIALTFVGRTSNVLFRPTIHAFAASLAFVIILYLKNFAMFGVFGPSSWAGMNLATMTHTNLSEPARRELVDSERTSVLTQHIPFIGLDKYPAQYAAFERSGVPVLDNETRFDGSSNFNQIPFIRISKEFGADAVTVIKAYPAEYLSSAARNVSVFLFRSSTDYRLIAANVARMHRWDALYSALVYGQPGSVVRLFEASSGPLVGQQVSLKNLPLREVVVLKAKEACLWVAIATLVIPLFALAKVPLRRTVLSERTALAAFGAVTLAYVFLTTNLVNFGESHRMRFEVEPLLWVFVGWLILEIKSWRRTRRLKG